jgi:hypothetical protein
LAPGLIPGDKSKQDEYIIVNQENHSKWEAWGQNPIMPKTGTVNLTYHIEAVFKIPR